MTTDPTGTAGNAVPNAADIYINTLRAQRDHLEVTVAGLRHRLQALEGEVAALREQADAAADIEAGQET